MNDDEEIKLLDELIIELNDLIEKIQIFNKDPEACEDEWVALEYHRKILIKKYYSNHEDSNILPLLG